jgi:hypothetical protein
VISVYGWPIAFGVTIETSQEGSRGEGFFSPPLFSWAAFLRLLFLSRSS